MKCSWTLPEAFPPVEASQVRIIAVDKGEKWFVDAANGKMVQQAGRTTFSAPRSEVNVSGFSEGVEYVAAVCCRNAEGFGEFSMESEPVAAAVTNGSSIEGMALVLHASSAAAPRL